MKHNEAVRFIRFGRDFREQACLRNSETRGDNGAQNLGQLGLDIMHQGNRIRQAHAFQIDRHFIHRPRFLDGDEFLNRRQNERMFLDVNFVPRMTENNTRRQAFRLDAFHPALHAQSFGFVTTGNHARIARLCRAHSDRTVPKRPIILLLDMGKKAIEIEKHRPIAFRVSGIVLSE